MKKEKWYNPTRHRIRFEGLPKIVQEYHGSKIDALVFRDKCKLAMDALKKLVKSDQVAASDLKQRLDFEDWTFIRDNIKVPIPYEIASLIEWQDSNKVTSITTAVNLSLAQMVQRHVTGLDGEGKTVSGSDMSPYNYWLTHSKIRNMLCQDLNLETLEAERVRVVNGYKGKTKTRSPSTANGIFSALNMAWARMMVKHKSTFPVNIPRQLTQTPDNDVKHTQAYTVAEVIAILEACYEADRVALRDVNSDGKRNRTTFVYLGPIIALFSETGIRNTFLRTLKVSEINMDCESPYIFKRMKRKRMVHVPLSAYAREIIEEQLLEPDVQESGLIFPLRDRNGKDIGMISKEWTKRFKRILVREGLTVTSKPIHSFRAYVATRLREQGYGIGDIADQLGIDDRSARLYVNQTPKQIKNLAAGLDKDAHNWRAHTAKRVFKKVEGDPVLDEFTARLRRSKFKVVT